MQPAWRFLDTGTRDAASNMAIDEALLLMHEADDTPPILRVYAWDTPTLSLGYAQNTAQEVNLTACQQHGVGIVRRPTGGRAVLHDREVTYSLILPTTLLQGTDTLTEHYRRIGLALTAALRQLGLPVHFERARRRLAVARRSASPACFSALARYEISVAGKKIVGSAQKRLRKSLLQHGSIPLELNRARLFQCLQTPAENQTDLIQEAYTTMTAINEIAPSPLSIPSIHQALQEGLAACFGIVFIQDSLQLAEQRLAAELRTTKYATHAWNFAGASAWRRSMTQAAGTTHLA
jgi:lipoate-protein ligase A